MHAAQCFLAMSAHVGNNFYGNLLTPGRLVANMPSEITGLVESAAWL